MNERDAAAWAVARAFEPTVPESLVSIQWGEGWRRWIERMAVQMVKDGATGYLATFFMRQPTRRTTFLRCVLRYANAVRKERIHAQSND